MILIVFFVIPTLVFFGLTWKLFGLGWMIVEMLFVLLLLGKWIFGQVDDNYDQPAPENLDYFWAYNLRQSYGMYQNGPNRNSYLEWRDWFDAKIRTDLAAKGRSSSDSNIDKVADYLARRVINGLGIRE